MPTAAKCRMKRRNANAKGGAGGGNHRGRTAALLLLRLSMLRGQRQGRGSVAEQGFALALAMIASFVLLLGVGALASRTQLGFVGQAFQGQNRQARDVAEAAIAEFVNTMNQERNRHLLIAGTAANWDSARWSSAETDFRNICTAFNDEMTPINPSAAPVITAPDAAAITRFTVGATRDLVLSDTSQGRFVVEEIKFLDEDRDAYVDAAGNFRQYTDPQPPNTTISYGTLFRTGSQRSLIRITVVGSVQRANGRVSTARVAREFEVVPKCCKRSFGRNVFGGKNWGGDDGVCGVESDRIDGLIAGMNGGVADGRGAQKTIIQEDGSSVTEATCWAGNADPNQPSDLSNDPNTPNQTCLAKNSKVNNISFTPKPLNFVAPVYSHPSGADPAAPVVNVDSSYNYLYFDPALFDANAGGIPDSANPNRFSGIVLRTGNSNFRRIDDAALSANSPDPCYIVSPMDQANGRPYYEINCRVSSIPTGSNTLHIDTTLAKINIFFVGTGAVGIASGSGGALRIHGNNDGQFRASLSTPTPATTPALAPSNCVGATSSANVAPCLIRWPAGTPGTAITQAQRLNTFLERCADRGGFDCDIDSDGEEDFSARRLLNFYASGTQSFEIKGGSSGVGFNIYAPFGDVIIRGGGSADNLMGQIWTNNLDLRGSITIHTFEGGGGQASGGGGSQGFAFGRPLIDFAARSFTQSSGFGL